MLGSSREDDLLNKLKNCIGSLKKQNASITEMRSARPSYSALKENYQLQKHDTKINNIPLSGRTNTPDYSYNLAPRQPLGQVNTQPTQPRRTSATDINRIHLPIDKINADNGIKPYGVREQIRHYEPNVRKFEYGSHNVRRPECQDRPINQISMNKVSAQRQQHSTRKPQQAEARQYDSKAQIARRYSMMQEQKSTNRYTKENDNTARITAARNYQRQVQERRNLVESEIHERQKQTPTRAKKETSYLKEKMEEAPTVRESANAFHAKQIRRVIVQDNPAARQQEKKKPSFVRQQLFKSYQENNDSTECSALGKLKKISELNEKINERIRNIINVFEQHKC